MRCSEHTEKEAVAVCVSCGRGLCEDCRLQLAGKNYCQECADKLVRGNTRQQYKFNGNSEIKTKGLDAAEFIVICLFSPIAGAIAWLVWHDKKPKKAQQACILAVVLFCIWLFIYVLYLAASASSYYYY
ncbi:MAG TPA: hypothetical protein VHO92_08265 [Methanobacterium sp.]|nr:hypothetical protein [Methanobacterium sp.]